MKPKITLTEFIIELKLLKESYIKRGWNEFNADERHLGRYQELHEILFELENNVIINELILAKPIL
jgi:hypothetical protein